MKAFVASVRKHGANATAMNIVYKKFKKELSETPDRSVVYICDESHNLL